MKAFPSPYGVDEHGGMDLRDYFAGQALRGMLSMKETHLNIGNETVSEQQIAGACYEWADAMMKARKQK